MMLRSRWTRRIFVGGLSLAVVVSLSGCAAIQENPRTVYGAAGGAAVGAGTGAAIGAIVGGKKGAGKGAAIGSVVGLIGGTVIGNYLDRQAREMQGILAEQDSIRREQERLVVIMPSDIMFAVNSADVAPGARAKLRDLGAVLNRHPRTVIDVIGHTDSTGSDEYNLNLSRRRANSVADELVAAGVSPSRITTRGMGKSMPIASNDTESGRLQNRRVEIIVNPDQSLRQEQGGGY